ncbi:MAG: tetratricopeptide repeat protein [Bacteroidales bacterium]|nr:tetratricopeptide repeat protein [Bacteroidales bacterium]
MIRLRYLLIILFLPLSLMLSGQNLSQAKKYFQAGNYQKALPLFRESLKSSPKRADLNQWVGICLWETGKRKEALPHLETASKSMATSNAYLASYYFRAMDYRRASDYWDSYVSLRDEDEEFDERFSDVKKAMDMLGNVERIAIIDSLVVDKADFFRHYRLSPEAGSISSTDILPYAKPKVSTSVFMPESKERMLWAQPDSTGRMSITESYKLVTGKWDNYSVVSPEQLNDGGDVNFPFLMADGTTLYYGCSGANSIGGYDIYMSRRDGTTGEYLAPQNIGFPYNSPYDDYLLAIDEMTGVGWWATDRLQIPGKVVIYIFVPNSVRRNCDPDSEDVYSLAAVNSIKDTWEDDADYSTYRERINAITYEDEAEEHDFVFHVRNGLTYTRFDDFRSAEARGLMEKHVKVASFIDDIRSQLADLRKSYRKASKASKQKYTDKIVTLERSILKNEDELRGIARAIRAAELSQIKVDERDD